jgi:hypothetical protein
VLIIDKSQYLLSKTAKTLLLAPGLLPPECRSVDQALKQSFISRREIALAQFLAKFPNEATLKRLAQLAFAAREFPEARQVTAFEALGDEKFLLVKNQPSSDVDGLNGQCSCR